MKRAALCAKLVTQRHRRFLSLVLLSPLIFTSQYLVVYLNIIPSIVKCGWLNIEKFFFLNNKVFSV